MERRRCVCPCAHVCVLVCLCVFHVLLIMSLAFTEGTVVAKEASPLGCVCVSVRELGVLPGNQACFGY